MAVNRLGIISKAPGTYPVRHSPEEIKLKETIQKDKNIDEDFDSQLVVGIANSKDGASTALLIASEPAAGDEISMQTRKSPFNMHVISIETTGTALWNLPFVSADGLELNPDILDGINALEITNGILSTSAAALTVGDAKFFFKAKIKIDDISDVTELWVGFRKAEAYQADPDNYDEMCAFNIGKDADGQIEIHTILNNGATSETDTTLADWVDGDENTLLIIVDTTGKCSFQIDGAEPTVVANFSFDDNEVIIPFVALTAETGDPGVSISQWQVGKY
jgi:hypothetical protein